MVTCFMNIVADELRRADQAFARNRLLATFTREARALVEPAGTITHLEVGDVVLQRGRDVVTTYFPFDTTMISMVVELGDGRSVEVASIGQEGAVGGIVSCGNAPAFSQARVLIAGPALKVPMAAIEDSKKRSAFISNLFCRYSDYLLAQVMQNVACNSFHAIPERAARWILTAQDRAGDRLELTQEALAGLLGAQRTSINAAVRLLQDEGLIELRRSAVTVIDRAALKRRACECYEVLERHFGLVIGPTGVGGSGDCG